MRYFTLMTFLIICTLVTPARAEYQSGYNPKEEYNCRYSLGSGRMFFHENGVTAPLPMSNDETDTLDEIAEQFKYTTYNFKFAVNGDLIRTILRQSNQEEPIIVHFQEVVENNEHVIIAYNTDIGRDIFANTIIFKNNNPINSIETINVFRFEDGIRHHFALTTQGRCEKVTN